MSEMTRSAVFTEDAPLPIGPFSQVSQKCFPLLLIYYVLCDY